MKKFYMETVVGIFGVISLIFVGYLTVKLGNISVFEHGYYPLTARFTSVSGLREGSSVEMMGIEVGRVNSMKIDQQSQLAVVDMQIKSGIKVYDDAIAAIRTSGLIGDKYVEIQPGGAGDLLKPGGTITETVPSVNIGDLIGKYAFGDVTKK
jgi:phospholipid/cholesterol/gamma-HCH transport system substrate-binding protein